MPEEWRNIDGYEGFYQVSSNGRVRRLDRIQHRRQRCRDGLWHEQDYFCKGRILVPNVGNHGYLTVGLCKDGKNKTQLVHRLVATAFIPNPEGLPQINHKDGVRTNDTVSNLEWSDQSNQDLYAWPYEWRPCWRSKSRAQHHDWRDVRLIERGS